MKPTRMFNRAKSPEERRKLKEEAGIRVKIAEASTTPEEIAKLFVDLPALTTATASIERRISTRDREDAISLLDRAYGEGRIEADECAVAKDRVHAARTRSEIDAAFHGLPTPTQGVLGKRASSATKQAAELGANALAEGGRRAGKAFRRGVLAVAALTIGIILVVAGFGVAALVFFLGAVVLFASAAISLASRTA